MEELTRRSFLTLGGAAAAGVSAAALVGTTAFADEAEEAEEETTTSGWDEYDQVELDVPEEEALEQTEYECDVVVAGCGVAGLHAAMAAKEAGKSVIVVDKGYPGYSGLTPYAGGTNFFDAQYGDDEDNVVKMMQQANEFITNLNWVRMWCENSRDYYDRICDWGIVNTYPHATETEYWVDGYFDGTPGHDDKRGYFQANATAGLVRNTIPAQLLADNDITLIDHTMLYDVVEQDSRVVGAVAYHVPSGTGITIKTKAVVLCTGSGCVRPLAYPVGASTWDGLYIGYKHGLPIGGLEFEDYHLAYAGKPGLVLTTAGWDYCECVLLNGPKVTADTEDSSLWGSGYTTKTVYNNVTEGMSTPDPYYYRTSSSYAASDYEDDPRQYEVGGSPETGWGAPGAAPGMSLHMASGIFNGWDDVEGKTGLAGLYCAGDGTYASAIGGADYDGISGLTTSSCGIQGWVAGGAAAAYADEVELVDLDEEEVTALYDELVAPLSVEKGYDPNWANQQLLNVMGTQTALFLKSEASLNAALVQVEFLRDTVIPLLKAKNTHEVRQCREFIHKVYTCEMKLRLGLERKESRGMHYRTDYPYRDDQYLGYFTVTKTDDDPMTISFVEEPDEFKGDLDLDYATRYPNYRYPGEAEATGIDFDAE